MPKARRNVYLALILVTRIAPAREKRAPSRLRSKYRLPVLISWGHRVPLVRMPCRKDNEPVRKPAHPEAEREAPAALFAGAMGSRKNAHSHRRVAPDDRRKA